MLTSLPPALLHRVRDAAAYVHDLAQLGLALLCPCDDDHGAGARWLTGEDDEMAKVPGLTDEWAEHQLALALDEHGAVDGDLEPLAPVCGSCTKVPGQPGAWDCDPDRPGCPLHNVPEVTR